MIYDFQALYAQDSNTYPWALVSHTISPLLEVYRHQVNENCFKVIADLQAPISITLETLANIEKRATWDDLCEEGKVIENVDMHTKINYMKTKAIWPTSARDAVTLSYVAKINSSWYVNVSRSIEVDGYPEDITGRFVRMNVKIAGQLVGPSPNGADMCRVVQIVDGDLRGWIPSSVLSYIASKSVPASFRRLNSIVSRLPRTAIPVLVRELQFSPTINHVFSGLEDTTDLEVNHKHTAIENIKEEASIDTLKTKQSAVTRTMSNLDIRSIQYILNIVSPWMVTILFIKMLVKILTGNRNSRG